jgi:hypothetical protein
MYYPRIATCLLALLTVPALSSRAATQKTAKAHGKVPQFADLSEVEGAFIVIRGALGPGSFFEDLQCVDSGDKTVFTNNAGEVLTFPNRLTITLLVIGPVPPNEFATPKRLDPKYMLGLRFSASWKRGVETRPVKAFRELTASDSQPPNFAASVGARQCWIYEFVVEDTDIPLIDRLIFYVFSPENKRLARLSAHF